MAVKFLVRGVSVSYKSVRALDGVSIALESGKITALVGPNGSGKTTLLRCLNGILKPSLGVVLLDGKEVTKLSSKELAKIVGYVPQSFSAFLPFTAFEVATMGRRPYVSWSLSEYDLEVVRRALEVTNSKHLADRYFDELSGGEKQRVVIAMALAQEPEVLLLDEPTSNLDLKHQLEVLGLVRELAEEHSLTVVMAMHDLNLAARFSDVAIMLRGGRVFSVGKPEDVLTPENIEQVYGVKVEVLYNPFRFIVPVGVVHET